MQSTSVHILPVLDVTAPPTAPRELGEAASFDSLLCNQPPAGPPVPPVAETYSEHSAPSDDATAAVAGPDPDTASADASDSAAIADGEESATVNDDGVREDERPDDDAAESIAATAAAVVLPPLPKPTPPSGDAEFVVEAPADATAIIQAATCGAVETASGAAGEESEIAAILEELRPPTDQEAVHLGLDAKQLLVGNAELKVEATETASRHSETAKDADNPWQEALLPSQFEQSGDNAQDQSDKLVADAVSGENPPETNRPQFSAVEQVSIPSATSNAKPAGGEPVGTISQTAAMDAAGGAMPRSRLPAAVLGREPAPSRGAVQIDTARLLSRVARAFTSAQQQGGEIQLRLSPPELGSLRLVVQIEDRALVAHLEAETPAARTALIDNLPALRERLAEQGVRIHRFDVDLMQRHAGDHPGGLPQRPPEQERLVFPQRAPSGPQPAQAVAQRPRLYPITSGGLNVIV